MNSSERFRAGEVYTSDTARHVERCRRPTPRTDCTPPHASGGDNAAAASHNVFTREHLHAPDSAGQCGCAHALARRGIPTNRSSRRPAAPYSGAVAAHTI